MSRNLLLFTINQLISSNIHLGSSTKIWNPLSKDLVFGCRQNYFINNLSLTIVNLRKSLNLIEIILIRNLTVLLYSDNIFLKNLILNNFKRLSLYKFYVAFGRWMPGLLTNFKVFNFFILNRLRKVKKYFKNKYVRKFIFNEKFWSFFFYLIKMYKLPSCVFSFNSNPWLVSETRVLKIPSMILIDTEVLEQVINHTTFLIPFNFLSTKSLVFLFFNFYKILIISRLKRKRLFYLLLISYLKLNYIRKNVKIKNFNLGYSLLINGFKFLKFASRTKLKKNINYLLFKKFSFLNRRKFFK